MASLFIGMTKPPPLLKSVSTTIVYRSGLSFYKLSGHVLYVTGFPVYIVKITFLF